MSAPITGDQGRQPKKKGKRREFSDILRSADSAYYRSQDNPRRRSGVDGYGRPGGPPRSQASHTKPARREFSDILRSADAAYYADKSQTQTGRKSAPRDVSRIRVANAVGAAGPEILTRKDAGKVLRGLATTLTETDRPVSVTVGKGLRPAVRAAMDQLIANGSLDADAAARIVFVDAEAELAKNVKAPKIRLVKVVAGGKTTGKPGMEKIPAPASFLDTPVLLATSSDDAGPNRGGDGFDDEAPDSFLDGHGSTVNADVDSLLEAPADAVSDDRPDDRPDVSTDAVIPGPADAADDLDGAADFLSEPVRSLEEEQPIVDSSDDLTAAAEEPVSEVSTPVETPPEPTQPKQGGRGRRRR